MRRKLVFALLASVTLLGAKRPADLAYTPDGQMIFPADYRAWIYLTSGLGMSYSTNVPTDHPAFDNVFVNPAAYKTFLATGTWPDKTVIVLEIRGSETKTSIDQRGHSQAEVRGVEVHVRNEKLPGKWGFYEFDPGAKTAKLTARPASCYTCHEAHGAVDTSFVQFYPTLMPIAREKKTLSAAYLKEMPTVVPAAAAKPDRP